MLYDGETIIAIAAVNDRSDFVSVAPPQQETAKVADEEEDDEGTGAPGSGFTRVSTRPASSTTSPGS
jgi:hypothetical protein